MGATSLCSVDVTCPPREVAGSYEHIAAVRLCQWATSKYHGMQIIFIGGGSFKAAFLRQHLSDHASTGSMTTKASGLLRCLSSSYTARAAMVQSSSRGPTRSDKRPTICHELDSNLRGRFTIIQLSSFGSGLSGAW